MKTMVVLLVSCALSLGTAQTFRIESERPGGGTYLLEGLGGVAGLALGAACGLAVVVTVYAATVPYAGGYRLRLGNAEVPLGNVGVTAFTALAFGAALPAWAGYGVGKVGENTDEGGSQTGAYIGAYAAVPVAIGLCVLGGWTRTDAGTITGVALGTLAVPAGAVIGYNFNSGRGTGLYGTNINDRIGLPVVMLDRVEREDHVAEFGVRVRLASLSF